MPIVDIGNSKQLEFGCGDIRVSAGVLEGCEDVVVTFTQSKEQPIGLKEIHDPPLKLKIDQTPVRMLFTKKESIDVVIRALQEAKQFMIDNKNRLT